MKILFKELRSSIELRMDTGCIEKLEESPQQFPYIFNVSFNA